MRESGVAESMRGSLKSSMVEPLLLMASHRELPWQSSALSGNRHGLRFGEQFIRAQLGDRPSEAKFAIEAAASALASRRLNRSLKEGKRTIWRHSAGEIKTWMGGACSSSVGRGQREIIEKSTAPALRLRFFSLFPASLLISGVLCNELISWECFTNNHP